jgi:DNA-binding CsgD family transcriptional regulator
MTSPVTVSERDLRTLLGIVSDDRSDLPAEGLPPSLLAELTDLIRCDVLSVFGLDSSEQSWWIGQEYPADFEDDNPPPDEVHWAHFWDCPVCSYPDSSGDLRSVTKISDFYSARQWRSTGMYSDYVRLWRHNLLLCLPAGPGQVVPTRTVRLCFWRGPGPDFSERDRALLALLRPHLHQAYLGAERRRRPTAALTPRHWELLRLVAAGHTNAQIGRRLGVTEKTVGKHLENVYARLQVSSRTAAVTRAFPGRATGE